MGVKGSTLIKRAVSLGTRRRLGGPCVVTPRGYIPVAVGVDVDETRRFVVHTKALSNAEFLQFLRTSAEEYGFCNQEMFPLKLVRSLVSGDDVTNNPFFLRLHHDNVEQESDDIDDPTISTNRTPLMLFVPNHELVRDTYRLASIARAIGMDLHPNPSLSHIIFSWPSPPPPPSCTPSSSSSSTSTSTSSSSSSTYSWSLPNGSVPLPFPSFATAFLSHLRLFVALSKGYFKLAFLRNGCIPHPKIESLSNNNWHCTSLSLFAAPTAERIDSMDGFSRALLGKGWTLFKTNCSTHADFQEMYLYRKLDVKQLANGSRDLRECSRVRELRLPAVDFTNAPLRILQYILLMTDDVFYLA